MARRAAGQAFTEAIDGELAEVECSSSQSDVVVPEPPPPPPESVPVEAVAVSATPEAGAPPPETKPPESLEEWVRAYGRFRGRPDKRQKDRNKWASDRLADAKTAFGEQITDKRLRAIDRSFRQKTANNAGNASEAS
jgi:hypothetical protein